MRDDGTLIVDSGISSLNGKTLAKRVAEDQFGAATNFLANLGLNNNDFIWVEGDDDFVGNVPVIMITDAGRP